VLLVYLTLTALGIALLAALGATGFDAVVHTFSGISTGGFAPRDSSLALVAARIQWGVVLLSMVGAISLPLYSGLRRGRWRTLRDDVEARALVALISVQLLLLLVVTRAGSGSAEASVEDLALLAISAQSTTGFSTFPVESLPPVALALIILAMMSGASLGSTGGGMKLLRILMVARLAQWLVASTRLPTRAVAGPTLSGERLDSDELLRAGVLVVLFVGALFLSWLPFLVYGYEPIEALFEVASAMGTVGLSTGLTRPELEPALKGLLCANMLLGRLEIFALLVALSPRTWIGRRIS
jgi:trk system potassium uptake protein TrkH